MHNHLLYMLHCCLFSMQTICGYQYQGSFLHPNYRRQNKLLFSILHWYMLLPTISSSRTICAYRKCLRQMRSVKYKTGLQQQAIFLLYFFSSLFLPFFCICASSHQICVLPLHGGQSENFSLNRYHNSFFCIILLYIKIHEKTN